MKQLSPEVLSPVNIIGADIRYVMYKLDDETIVQKYQYKATLEEIEKEKAAATNTLRLGLPTVISFEPVQIGDDYGIVYERMGSGSLGNLIMSHPSRFIDYVGDFVALEHRMHATHVDKDAFPSAKQTISDLYDEALERGVYTADEVAAVGRMLAAIPDRDTYLHLSCGPRTTRYVDGELTLTQVVDASYGHPVLDVSSTALQTIISAQMTPEDDQVMLTANTNVTAAIRFWHAFVRQYFGCTTSEDAAEVDRLMLFAQWLRFASFAVSLEWLPEQSRAGMRALSSERFFPNIDQWISDMEGVWERFE
ncbi:MAG: hypothetical protein LKE37_01865 [Atopobiaceae bacterium]|jgi:hypothetical protein|nr:hypothetical protein [Atopobiaceae bacterium]